MNKNDKLSPVIPIRRRLSQFDVADLEFLWLSYEAEIGVKGIDYSNVRVEGGELVFDPLTSTVDATTRARRIRARLTQMSPAHVRILYRTYGDRNPFAPFGRLGDVAPLTMYTTTAQAIGDREAVEKAISKDEKIERKIRVEAERLLLDASDAYRRTK